jgi:hypothetical protein
LIPLLKGDTEMINGSVAGLHILLVWRRNDSEDSLALLEKSASRLLEGEILEWNSLDAMITVDSMS